MNVRAQTLHALLYRMVIAQPLEIMYCGEVCYMSYQPPSEKWRLFETIQPSHAKRFVCCSLTIQYNIYHMVGRSIAASHLSKYGTSGWIYRQWTSLPYDIYYYKQEYVQHACGSGLPQCCNWQDKQQTIHSPHSDVYHQFSPVTEEKAHECMSIADITR